MGDKDFHYGIGVFKYSKLMYMDFLFKCGKNCAILLQSFTYATTLAYLFYFKEEHLQVLSWADQVK